VDLFTVLHVYMQQKRQGLNNWGGYCHRDVFWLHQHEDEELFMWDNCLYY